MNRELVKRLLLYLVDQLQDRDSPRMSTRLVKLLYLIDLEHYNRYYKTLTGIDWVRYTHGPYFFKWPDIIKFSGLDLEPEEVLTERGKGTTYKVFEEQDISDVASRPAKRLIDNIIEKWADEDLQTILDYVYETLPVKHATLGKPLDFTLETDHLILEEAKRTDTERIPLDELDNDEE